ncbi:MAG: hypothetical protein ACPG4T_02185 [Nannocystaceae bacterium]
MNLSSARVVLRTRDLGELFDLGGRAVFALGGRLYLYLFVCTSLPLAVGFYLLHTLAEVEPTSIWLLAVMALWVNQGVYTIAASRLMFSEKVGFGEVVGQFLRRLPSYLIALMIAWIVLFLTSLLVIGFIWGLVWTLYIHEASLLEMQGPFAAFRRARVLARNNFPGLFGFSSLTVLVAFFAIVSAEMLGHGLVDFVLQLGEPFGELQEDGISLYAMIGVFAMAPFWATVRFLFYIDGRTRQDGWDIQLRFSHLAAVDEGEEGAG